MKYKLNSFIDKYQVKAKKSFGQNFLKNQDIIDKIIDSFDYDSYDLVVEIGPGLGALTIPLSQKHNNVIAVESDIDMFNNISDIMKIQDHVKIFQSDFRYFDMSDFNYDNLLIISNLPYNLTSDLITYCCKLSPKAMGFMVQKEVALKYLYKEGKKDNDSLGAFLNMCGKVSIVTNVDRNDFNPIPNVDSAFIKIVDVSMKPLSYLNILKKLFKDPNKTILNNIKNGFDNEILNKLKESHENLLTFRARQCSINQLEDLCLTINNLQNNIINK